MLLLSTHSHDPLLVGESDVPHVVHQPASPSIWPAVAVTPAGLSTNPGVTMCVRMVGAVEEMMCVVCVDVAEGHSGDGCVLASTLCKYDFRNGDLFVLRLGKGATGEAGSLSSELLMCGGGVRSILLLPLVARCLETIDVCIWRMFVFMSVVVTVWGVCGNGLLCSGRC